MYVCMYVCMHACMYVCMYVCTYVCIYMYVCCLHVCSVVSPRWSVRSPLNLVPALSEKRVMGLVSQEELPVLSMELCSAAAMTL